MATPGSAADAPPAGQQKVIDLIDVKMPTSVVVPSEPHNTLTVFALAAVGIALVHWYRRRRPSQRKDRASKSER